MGISRCGHRRDDVTHPELVYEAVREALDMAGLWIDEVDCIVYGTMDPFDGILAPEKWDGEAMGVGRLKPMIKVTTGGTTGMSIALTAYTLASSGLFDVVMAVSGQRVSENVEAQKVLNLAVDPFHDRPFGIGAIAAAAFQASSYMHRLGDSRRVEEAMAMVSSKNRTVALRNPKAHLKRPLTVEEALRSPLLIWPIKYSDSCPSSDGSAAVIFASERAAKRISDRRAWVLAADTISDSYYWGSKDLSVWDSLAILARRVYKRAGITDPRRQIDTAELYDAFSIQEILEYEAVGFAEKYKGTELLFEGLTDFHGDLPVNASGGVLSTNPIGATGLIKTAEAALQVMGAAGEHQVPDAQTSIAHAWGGALQFHTLIVLSSEIGVKRP
ncbi:MAG: thiolase family protein [Nitrososphaerota archaeon]|nr:thiolase family protein [Nitrososphaerota archaeon]